MLPNTYSVHGEGSVSAQARTMELMTEDVGEQLIYRTLG